MSLRGYHTLWTFRIFWFFENLRMFWIIFQTQAHSDSFVFYEKFKKVLIFLNNPRTFFSRVWMSFSFNILILYDLFCWRTWCLLILKSWKNLFRIWKKNQDDLRQFKVTQNKFKVFLIERMATLCWIVLIIMSMWKLK